MFVGYSLIRTPSKDASIIFAIFGWSHSARILISLIRHSKALCLHMLAALLTFKNLMATRLFKWRSTASFTLHVIKRIHYLPGIASITERLQYQILVIENPQGHFWRLFSMILSRHFFAHDLPHLTLAQLVLLLNHLLRGFLLGHRLVLLLHLRLLRSLAIASTSTWGVNQFAGVLLILLHGRDD